MRGKRAKQLRADFLAHYGRYPKRTRLTAEPVKAKGGKVIGMPLPGRPYIANLVFDKEVNGVVLPAVTERQTILRPLCSVTITKPSEWRRWKKTHGNVPEFEVRMGWRSRHDTSAEAILPATELPEAA